MAGRLAGRLEGKVALISGGATGMGGAAELCKAKVLKECVIFCQLDTCFQFQTRKLQGARARFGVGDKASGEAPAPLIRQDREFAEVKLVWHGCQDHAGVWGLADDPDFRGLG